MNAIEPIDLNFRGVILRRFLNAFQSVTHHGVPICKYIYFQFFTFIRHHVTLIKEHLPYWSKELQQFKTSEIYSWSDEPYIYDPHPDGIILMRGGFGYIAKLFLPKERFFLISPTQAEVDLSKAVEPGLVAHNFENYYRENPQAVSTLIAQVTQIIHQQKDDPILGSPDLLQWFKDKIPEIVCILDAAQLLFESLNVGAVLTTDSTCGSQPDKGMDCALNLIARANRIPSLTIQHGLFVDAALFYYVPILATKKLVWGNEILRWYKKYGFPESRVSVIGSPRFDAIFNQTWCGKQKLCQMLNIDPSKKIIVYATQPLHSINRTIVPIILDSLASIPDVFLIMILHHSEGISAAKQYEQYAQGYSNCKVVQFGQISLYNALSGADFFITYVSTSALEAMLFKLPIITVEPSPPGFSYGDAGASLKVTNSTELHQVVTQLISNEAFRKNSINQYQKFISENCIPDGCASQRLFQEVELLCRTGGIA